MSALEEKEVEQASAKECCEWTWRGATQALLSFQPFFLPPQPPAVSPFLSLRGWPQDAGSPRLGECVSSSRLIPLPASSMQTSQQTPLLPQSVLISSPFGFCYLWAFLFARYLIFFFIMGNFKHMWRWRRYDELPCPHSSSIFNNYQLKAKPVSRQSPPAPSCHVLLLVLTSLVLPWGDEF